MRDRLIWCQLLRHARDSALPILIVSNDSLFKNGANSEEGAAARIECVEDDAELSQRLDARPTHIQAVVDEILLFAPKLREIGFDLKPESLEIVENLRMVKGAFGSLVKTFTLRTTGVPGLEPPVDMTILSIGSVPVSLSFAKAGKMIIVARDLNEAERKQLNGERIQAATKEQLGASELQSILRS